MNFLYDEVGLHGEYKPGAIYYEGSDSLEYIRTDEPVFYRRIDQYLTLVLELHSQNAVGFKLKGFKHLYLMHLKPKYDFTEPNFVRLISILEDTMSLVGAEVFEKTVIDQAYKQAKDIALEDKVKLGDFPTTLAC